MKILFLTTKFPYPPDSGGKIDTYNNLFLLSKNFDVILIYLEEKSKYEDAFKYKTGIKDIYNFPLDVRNRFWSIILNLFSRNPYTVKKYHSKEIYRKIKDLIKKENISVLFLDHLHVAFYGELAKKDFPSIKILLREHNVESEFWQRMYLEEKSFFKRLYFKIQAKKILDYEKNIVKIFNKCLIISKRDEEILHNICKQAKTVAVPTAINLNEYKKYWALDPVPFSIIFVGDYSWPPNTKGILWFLEEVWPRVKNNFPEVKIFIVGRNPTNAMKKYLSQDVIITGEVKSVKEWIARASIFIAPLFSGAGIRIKILEAMAMERPVISTSLGAEGINIKHMKNIIIADTKEQFLDGIKYLFAKKENGRKLAKNGRRMVEVNHSFKRIEEILRHAIKD